LATKSETYGQGGVEAITAADLVICPRRPGMFDQSSLVSTSRLLDMADAKPCTVGVVNAVRVGRCIGLQLIEAMGIKVAATFIGDKRSFMTAVEEGKGVTEKKGAKYDAANRSSRFGMNQPCPALVINLKDHRDEQTI